MAQSTEEVPNLTGMVTDPELFPSQLPEGVQKTSDWYAHRRTYRDGRQVWEFFKRNSGGGPVDANGKPGDAVAATFETEVPSLKEKWDKEQKEQQDQAAPPGGLPTRTVNGQVFQWNPATRAYDIPTGSTPASARQPVREYTGVDPQTNKPATITEYSDGSKTYAEIKPGQTARKPVREYAGTDPQTNRPATVTEYDDGSKTYAEIKPGPAGQAKPVREYSGTDPQTGRPATVTEYSDGTKTYAETKPGAEKPRYTTTQLDKDTGKWWGLTPDGRWEELPPGGPGSRPAAASGPGSSGPALPVMVVGQSQAALRQYRDQLQAEVAAGRQTQAWADNRWAEAKEIATFTIQEAQLMQQERQSALNANINLATTKLNHETSGIKTALEFALAINGKLPPGSPLGGQAFAALLGLNMIAAQRSGIYDIKPPSIDNRSLESRGIEAGAGTARATTNNEITRLTNPGDPKALEAQRAEIQAQLQQEAGISNTTDQGGVPREKTPAAASSAPPPMPAPAPAAPPAPAPAAAPPVAAPPVAAPAPAPAPAAPGLMPPGPVPNLYPGAPPTVPNLPFNPPPGQPGHTQGAPVGQAEPAPPEFAALSQYQPMPTAMTPPPPAPQMDIPQQEPLALLRARAAATPVWRMSNDEIARYLEAGVPEEDILRLPTMPGVMG